MIDELFWTHVEVGDCWEWVGAKRAKYGIVKRDGRTLAAHRYVWEMLVGPIPPGMQVDHLCRAEACVNPDHLEVVTPRENVLRARRRPFCKRGHRIAGSNVITAEGKRRCRACNRVAQSRYNAKR